MTLKEKAAHFYRTDVETIENFTMAYFFATSPESAYMIVAHFFRNTYG